MLPKLRSLLLCTIALFAVATTAAQNTIHVPADQPTIQAGINAANTGDTVLVAPGTYYENIDFKGKAITVTSTSGPGGGAANTIIDGSKGTTQAVNFDSGEPRSAILNGFTIQNGGHEGYGDSIPIAPGIYVGNASPTIVNNILTHNYCYSIESDGAPLIQNNEIDNTLDTLGDCSFAGGAAIYLSGDIPYSTAFPVVPIIIGNMLQNNMQSGLEDAGGNGGAGIADWIGVGVIEDNTIRNNLSYGQGTAIHLFGNGGLVVGNLAYNNQSGGGGGGLDVNGFYVNLGIYPTFNAFIANNTFANNTYIGGGGSSNDSAIDQIYFGSYGFIAPTVAFANNIVYGDSVNPAVQCGWAGLASPSDDTLVLDHNLFYNAGGPIFTSLCSDHIGTYGNINADPKFVDAKNANFALSPDSPAIDAGNNGVLAFLSTNGLDLTTDLAGHMRLQDATGKGYPIIDIGALEATGPNEQNATTLLLTPSGFQAAAGQSFNLAVKAFSPLGTPTGEVTFVEDQTKTLAKVTLDSTASATYSPALVPGIHHFFATYPGVGAFSPAISVQIIVLVSNYSPSLTLASTPNPSNLGQSVKFNVNISSADTNQLGPIVVTNTNNNTTLATLTPDASGNASFSTSSLPLGYNYIQANYAGDATHNSASASVEQDVVSASATTTTLTSSLNPSTYGQSVTFKATVSATTTPTGSITFTDGTTTLSTLPLDASGDASFTTSALAANDPGTTPNHPITATYNPTGSFAASSASLSQVVNGLPTTNTLTISPSSGTTSTTYTLTATLKSASSVSSAAPTGTVTFYISPTNGDPGIQIGSATLTNGVATLTSSSLPVSSGFVYELYPGDSIYANSTSNSINVNITAAGPSTTTTTLAITAAGSPVTTVPTGTVVTLTATTLAGTSPVTPGQINFCDATAPLCTDIHLLGTAQLTSAGTAALKFIPGPGTHSYKAVFLGTQANTTSSSPAEPLTVGSSGSNATTTTLSATGTPGNYTLSAVVSGSLPAPPAGTVSFLDTTNAYYVLGTATLTPNAGGLTLLNSSTNTVNTGPLAIVTADFNGDGIPDIATSGSSFATIDPPGTITILLGKGDGTFSQAPTITTPPYPYYLVVGDFNNDGIPDLAFTSTRTSSVTILLGNGDGTFSPAPTASLGLQSGALAVGDFNGDGNADLAVLTVTDYNSPQVLSILLGNGDGTFSQLPTQIQVGTLTLDIRVGDFNLDGKPDLAISDGVDATGNPGNIYIFLGNGDGTFTAAPTLTTGVDPRSLAIADINGDGKPDIISANNLSFSSSNLTGSLSIFLGHGDGTFNTALSPPAGLAPGAVTVANINGDGKPDLVVTPVLAGDGNILLLLGNGDGTFNTVTGPLTGTNPWSNAVADFNGDGLDDVAVSESFTNQVNVYLTQLGGSSATATVANISPVGTGPHLVDANYPGDSTYATSLSNTVSLTAQRVPTTLTLTATAAPSGSPITLTAAISPNTAQNHSAGGTVTFYNNGVSLSTGNGSTVSNGVANLAVTSLPIGSNNLTAQYSGDTNFAPSSGTGSITIGQSIPPDFTFIGPPTITFRTEANGVATLSLASLSGFTAPIAITCNGPLPPNYLCTLSSSTVTLAANNTASLTLKLHPNINASLISPPAAFPSKTVIAMASLLPLTLLTLFRRKRRNLLHSLLLLLCLTTVATALTACGSDIYYAATPPGLYPITVTATGTNQGGSTPTTHTLLLNANITP